MSDEVKTELIHIEELAADAGVPAGYVKIKMSSNGFGLKTVEITVAFGLISLIKFSISVILFLSAIGSSHIVNIMRSPNPILYGPK